MSGFEIDKWLISKLVRKVSLNLFNEQILNLLLRSTFDEIQFIKIVTIKIINKIQIRTHLQLTLGHHNQIVSFSWIAFETNRKNYQFLPILMIAQNREILALPSLLKKRSLKY